MRIGKGKKILCLRRGLALSLALTLTAPFNSFAAEKPADMDEATWARLQDNTLEYDEIEDLVVLYNPTYNQVISGIQANVDPMIEAGEDYHQAAREYNEDVREYKEDGDLMNQMISKGMAEASGKAADEMEKLVRTINGGSSAVRNQLRKQMTKAVRQLDRTYAQLLSSKAAADAGVELAQAAYESSVTQQSIGMATAADVQTAQKAFQSAQNQQKMLEDTLTGLRQNLAMMTGWPYNAEFEIAPVSAPDLGLIDQMNPETDLEKALNNNYTLRQNRGLSHKSSVERDIRNRTLGETEAKIKTGLEALYQAVQQNRQAYEAAQSAFSAAQITMDGNETKYQLGMLGRLQYLQARMAYLGAAAAADTAALNLRQAIEDYQWALEGIMELP